MRRIAAIIAVCVMAGWAVLAAIAETRNPGIDPRPTGANFRGLNLHQGGVGSYETPKPMLFK